MAIAGVFIAYVAIKKIAISIQFRNHPIRIILPNRAFRYAVKHTISR